MEPAKGALSAVVADSARSYSSKMTELRKAAREAGVDMRLYVTLCCVVP